MTFSLLAAATLANGLLIGLIPVVVDGAKTSLKVRLNFADNRLNWFNRLFYATWLPAMPLAGWLLDQWPNRDLQILLFGGLIPLIFGVAWIGLARSTASLLLTALLLGVAYSFVATSATRLMTVAFFPDYVADYPLNIASLNLGFVSVGIGALIAPWVLGAIERWAGARQGFLYLSIALLLPAIMTALCDGHSFPQPMQTTASWDDVFGHPQLALLAVVLLVYFALENYLEYWPDAYLKEIGYHGGNLQVGLVIFWLAFIGMRSAAAWWLYENPHQGFAMTLVLLGLSALVLGNLAGGFEFGSGSFGFFLLGACYGPLLPGLVGIALDLNLGNESSTKTPPTWALGMLLALSGFDTLIARPVLDVFARNRAARNVMRGPAVLALLAVAILLVLAFLRN